MPQAQETVYIKTLGCKVNTYDSDALTRQFSDLGFKPVSSSKEATITVVNTCSVTAKADKEARYLFRKFRRDNPNTKIVATGCYAQVDSATIASLNDVDFIVPNQVKDSLATMVLGALRSPEDNDFSENKLPKTVRPVRDNRGEHFKSVLKSFPKIEPGRTRAFLKIQDGCNGFCTYCLIPYARGASRSVAPDQVYDEVRRLVDEGIKEIVFTGIHIGDYGDDLGPVTPGERPFIKLLDRILSTSGLERFRISSLEPSEASQELIDALARHPDKICDHFHLPLQSGHDRILKLMRRQYNLEEYAAGVARIKKAFPNAMIGADIIPGFPSETEEEHQASMRFVEEIGLHALHVFPYSKRPNTAAAKMPGHLDPVTVKTRADELRDLANKLSEAYYRTQVGRTVKVLWEKDQDESGRLLGHSTNYLRVAASKKINPQVGDISLVHLQGFCGTQTLLATQTL